MPTTADRKFFQTAERKFEQGLKALVREVRDPKVKKSWEDVERRYLQYGMFLEMSPESTQVPMRPKRTTPEPSQQETS